MSSPSGPTSPGRYSALGTWLGLGLRVGLGLGLGSGLGLGLGLGSGLGLGLANPNPNPNLFQEEELVQPRAPVGLYLRRARVRLRAAA